MTLRRGLAILLLVSVARSSLAAGQDQAPDGGQLPAQASDGGAAVGPPAAPLPEAARPLAQEPRSLVPSTEQASEAPPSVLREVPVATWVCAGFAAALFGVALGFGVTANDIDHRAGVNVSPSGVDLGLTRRTALAGQTDANVANGLFVAAGVVALVGLAFAAFSPEPASRWEAPIPAKSP